MVWTVLGRKLTKEPVTSAEDLRKNLKQSFDDLTVEYCRKLFDSIRRRCELCIEKKVVTFLIKGQPKNHFKTKRAKLMSSFFFLSNI